MRPSFLNRTLLLLTLAMPFSTIPLVAQVSQNRSVSNFNKITVSHGIDLYLVQDVRESLKITTHADLMKDVVVEQHGTAMEIKLKGNFNWSKLFKGQSIRVYVRYKTLHALNASGGSDVETQNTMKTDQMVITASGGSDLEMDIDAKELKLTVSGGSDADLRGRATHVSLTASGGSDIEALELKTDYAKIEASGGSDVNISVSKAIQGGATGGSDIRYRGNAVLKKTSSSVSGDIKRIN